MPMKSEGERAKQSGELPHPVEISVAWSFISVIVTHFTFVLAFAKITRRKLSKIFFI